MIAHRLSTVRDANKIVYFEKGEIAEMVSISLSIRLSLSLSLSLNLSLTISIINTYLQGTHAELVALGGRYYDLVKAQQFQPEADQVIIDEAEDEIDLG